MTDEQIDQALRNCAKHQTHTDWPTDTQLLAEWYRVANIAPAGERRLACMRAVLHRWGSAAPAEQQPIDTLALTLPDLPEPLEIHWPDIHYQSLGCGLEDRDLTNRYDCAEYGWDQGVERAMESVPEEVFDADQLRSYAVSAIIADRLTRN